MLPLAETRVLPAPEPAASSAPPAGAGRAGNVQGTSASRAELERLAEGLRPAILRLSRQLLREAQRVGLSALDAQLLAVVKHRKGLGVSELAALERMSVPTMSAHVKRLEASGWVERAVPEAGQDRRRTPLALTVKGRKALEGLRRSRTDWLLARLARLDADERLRLEAALAALSRLHEIKP